MSPQVANVSNPAGQNRLRSAPFRRTFDSAFTLIELLVVIGIIGILVALLVTVIPKVKRAVYAAQTSAQLSAISNAIQQYYGDFKAYPGPLPNNQLGAAYDPSSPIYPYVGNTTTGLLVAVNPTGTTNINLTKTQLGHITGAQNLVLGLLGGLEYNPTNYPSTPFIYNPLDLFPDGKNPAPVGASSLNPNNPRRQQSYIQVKAGDLSLPSMTYNAGNGASYADSASRSPSDAPIPVFLDKYPDPLPIIYIRTNYGGQAIVGVRNTNGNGSALIDSGAQSNYGMQVNEIPQYDLCQLFDYTKANPNNANGAPFGVILTSRTPYHGLQGLGSQVLAPPGPIDVIGFDTVKAYPNNTNGYANSGQNGVAYFRDPNYVANITASYDPLASNTHNGFAREKNGYLLICAGPDRAYGTSDDIIFPGALLSP
jgi:prepilin-type N-terminal cleavage/methylation domain-containing protein